MSFALVRTPVQRQDHWRNVDIKNIIVQCFSRKAVPLLAAKGRLLPLGGTAARSRRPHEAAVSALAQPLFGVLSDFLPYFIARLF